MAHELRTRARSSGRAAVERRTAFIGPTPPASERVPPRMWCTVNHLGMMTFSEPSDADVRSKNKTGRDIGLPPRPPRRLWVRLFAVLGEVGR